MNLSTHRSGEKDRDPYAEKHRVQCGRQSVSQYREQDRSPISSVIENEIEHVVPEGRTKEDQSTGQDVLDHDASVTVSHRKTDYGFGQLEDGSAIITIDPVFAQTVNLEEPYHVFVQVYGDAEVYVSNRTPTQFEVHLRDGAPDIEFSYRIVAKRLGYEEDRLERAPWADNDPNLYPEKQAALDTQQESSQP